MHSFVDIATTYGGRPGDIIIELYDDEAPITVANFKYYVTHGLYQDSFFHRLAAGFVLQGGGYTYDGQAIRTIPTNGPIANEFSPARSNVAQTVAMAKLGGNPNSATDQFFFNLGNNAANLDSQNGGFTVFGKVVQGWDIVTGISSLPTVNKGSPFDQLPVQGYSSGPVTEANLVEIKSATLTIDQSYFGTVTKDGHSPGGEVYALYDGLLGRAPDTAGLEYWADAFARGVSPSVLAKGFLDSPEGMARSGAADNATFVTQLYHATLHRDPDAAGLDYWTADLNAGDSRGNVGAGFALSAEHLANIQPALNAGLFVPDKAACDAARIYWAVLDRAPDANGLAFWTASLKSGTPIDTMTKGFLLAPEVVAKTNGLSTSQFVDLIYENALGRHADAAGLAYWADAIDNHGAGRVSVTTAIGESAEAQQHHLADIEAGWHLA